MNNINTNTTQTWTAVLNSLLFKRQGYTYHLATFGNDKKEVTFEVVMNPDGANWTATFRYIEDGATGPIALMNHTDKTKTAAFSKMLVALKEANKTSLLVNAVNECFVDKKVEQPKHVAQRYSESNIAANVVFEDGVWKSRFVQPNRLLREVLVNLHKEGYKPVVHIPKTDTREKNRAYYNRAKEILKSVRYDYPCFTWVIKGERV